MKLGLDFGSKNIHFALIDNDKVVESGSMANEGDIPLHMNRILEEIYSIYSRDTVESIGLCGNFEIPALEVIHPVVAAVQANLFLKLNAGTILSIGCENFYLIRLDRNGGYLEHSMNSDCASGTGGFIDQQAERIGYSSEELAEKAFIFKGRTPAIATRCAVFAKTDIIHAQALGYSREAIAAGICEGVARSILENVVRGKKIDPPIILAGGVSCNRKIAAEISSLLGSEAIVPKENQCLSAIGAALLGKELSFDIDSVMDQIKKGRNTRENLLINLPDYPDFSRDKTIAEDGVEITVYKDLIKSEFGVYIGIDIGSTSTKLIVLSEEKEILTGMYTRTKGDPVSAVSLLMGKLEKLFGKAHITIKGCQTTGSGRELIREVVGTDGSLNEISAHAYGAVFLDPDVDTIIEIGGQDSKFTVIENGEVVHSAMNYVCAAGTGFFIEEQASRLGIGLDDIPGMADGSAAPFTSDRCTVYMERDLNTLLAEGWTKAQIITAVLYSVKDNYLSKVVGKTPIGKKVYFQGATARNKALVAVFQSRIGRPISVSRFCHLTGVLGAALDIMRKDLKESRMSKMEFRFTAFNETCGLCFNSCQLTVYDTGSKKTAWGLKCGREYEDGKARAILNVSKLEKSRNEIFRVPDLKVDTGLLIGLPTAVYMEEYYPLFRLFFNNLGIRTIVEHSGGDTIKEGKPLINSDFCAPINIAHGQVKKLLDKKVDYIFFPSVLNEKSPIDLFSKEIRLSERKTDCYFCYYSVYAPTILKNLSTINLKVRLLSPLIKFNGGRIKTIAEEIAKVIIPIANISQKTIIEEFYKAYREFKRMRSKLMDYGQEILSNSPDKIKILLLGRPYSIFDRVMNNEIPMKIESMGYEVVHQSMFRSSPFNNINLPDFIKNMHWHYGQEILLMQDIMRNHCNIYPILVTCFRCSPDSYVLSYFREILYSIGKPYLVLQLDEHGSDIGYQTRIEAGIEAFRNDFNKLTGKTLPVQNIEVSKHRVKKEDILLMAEISPILSELDRMAYEAHGYKCVILKASQKDINEGYNYATGGECMPNIAILGSIINTVKNNNLDPARCVFQFSTACIPCNFTQFTRLVKLACSKAGIGEIRISAENIIASEINLPLMLYIELAANKIITSILYKLFFHYSAYETHKGDSRAALEESLYIMKTALNGNPSLFEQGQLLMDCALFLTLTNFNLEGAEDKSAIENNIRKALKELVMVSHPARHILKAAVKIRKVFEKVSVNIVPKPRIAIIGDLYVKWNTLLNEDIYSLVGQLGGEIIIPSFTEYATGLLNYDIHDGRVSKTLLQHITLFERRFEDIFSGMIDGYFEPSVEECDLLAREYGIEHFIPGETEINIGRVLYMKKQGIADAFLHLNPVFCCPGAVSSSIFRRIQKDFDVPIIDIFYDGSNKPNKMIIPYMYYLARGNKVLEN